jgi:MFS family permease
VLVVATAVFGVGLILFAASRALWLSLASMGAVGFGLMVHLAAGNTLAQAVLEDDKRGRVMSFFAMAFIGIAPLGALLAGSLARVVGAPVVVGFGGAACIASSVWFASRRPAIGEIVRPLYARSGVVPEEPGFPCGPGLAPPPTP